VFFLPNVERFFNRAVRDTILKCQKGSSITHQFYFLGKGINYIPASARVLHTTIHYYNKGIKFIGIV